MFEVPLRETVFTDIRMLYNARVLFNYSDLRSKKTKILIKQFDLHHRFMIFWIISMQ